MKKWLFAVCAAVASLQLAWAGATKYFFVMIPPDFEEWMSSVPMLSLDGGKTGKPMNAVPDMCGWYSYVFFNETITDNVFLYRDDDVLREDMIGANGNWEQHPESPEPIALNMMFGDDNDSLFFVPDEEQKANDDGFYFSKAEVEGIEGTCSYPLAAIIYDTDASLHGAFTCYPKWHEGITAAESQRNDCYYASAPFNIVSSATGYVPCIGVTKGMVSTTLDPSVKKPTLTSQGRACFGSQTAFDAMFNYTSGVNEQRCYEMPFVRNSNGLWSFNSDTYTGNGLSVQGGFYPVETPATTVGDGFVLADDPAQMPVSAARTKRRAEGPIFYSSKLRALNADEHVPEFNLLCKGPGWNKGIDCSGLFFDADETASAIRSYFNMEKSACVFGWSCSSDAPAGWHFYTSGTELETIAGNGAPQWTSETGRNQHFCFESHAKFTFKSNLKFSIRGDDDIWVYIDNKLAVDLGGAHMAAPGYVDLDDFLPDAEPGDEKDLDIFFCDRRTTVSTMEIQTNMHIRQKKTISSKEIKTRGNPYESSFSLCYVQTGDGSCVSALSGNGQPEDVELCGAQMAGLDIRYFVVNGYRATDPVMTDPLTGAETLSVAGTYFGGGLDLTTLYAPKIDVVKFTPPPGKGGVFSLFVTIGGKAKRLKKWRIVGEVDVVYADAKSYWIDSLDNLVPDVQGRYLTTKNAMGGQFVPVYISAVTPSFDGGNMLDIIRTDAVGISYTLDYPRGMKVYTQNAGVYQELGSGVSRTIDNTGIDTVYVTVPMELLEGGTSEYQIGVKGRTNKLTINFYMPKIIFVDKPADLLTVVGDTPNPDGTYDEHWVGQDIEFYMAIVKPDGNGYYVLCEDCNLSITAGPTNSPEIILSPDTIWFENGFATFSVRAQKAYRYDADPTVNNPAVIAVNGLVNGRINDYIYAMYTPIYFRESPQAYPVFADVFDVRGTLPTKEYNIPAQYFNKDMEYLDGIGDSVVIYYDRRLHQDSLPTHLCILWDSLSAKSYLPAVEGWSNLTKDFVNSVLCNEVVEQTSIKCQGAVDEYGYCAPYITLSGLKLSDDVKTSGVGRVYSYTKYVDRCGLRNGAYRCDTVKAGFDGEIVDRIAPVPLSAVVRTLMNGDELGAFDSLVVILSEPVKLLETVTTGKNRALDFYLNSAIEYSTLDRYASALGNSSILVEAMGEPVVSATYDQKGRIKYLYRRGGNSPHDGDYVRLGGDLSLPLWSDIVDYHTPNGLKADSIRAAANAVDAVYFWNSPTGYAETSRLPSCWIPVKEGAVDIVERNEDDEIDPEKDSKGGRFWEDTIAYAKPSFRVKMVGPFEFVIVMDDPIVSSVNLHYSVMDLQGRILRQGNVSSTETIVQGLGKGSYVVKVGLGMRRVNIR